MVNLLPFIEHLTFQIPRIALENLLISTTEIPKNPKEVRLRRVKYPPLNITQLIRSKWKQRRQRERVGNWTGFAPDMSLILGELTQRRWGHRNFSQVELTASVQRCISQLLLHNKLSPNSHSYHLGNFKVLEVTLTGAGNKVEASLWARLNFYYPKLKFEKC